MMKANRNNRNQTEYKIFDNCDIFRFVFEPISSNMYMILEDDQALVIDPNISEDAYSIMRNAKISFVTIFLTHEHHDHTSGVNWYREKFESKLFCQRRCAERIAVPKNNRPLLVARIIADKDKSNGRIEAKQFASKNEPYICIADEVFDIEMEYRWNRHLLRFTSTPGHSPGSCCILMDDQFLFTGDSLIKDMPVITRFPEGSRGDYEKYTKPFLSDINDDIWILPGHGDEFQKKMLSDFDDR